MDLIEKYEYHDLSQSVGYDNEIQSALKEGYEILGRARNTPLKDKFEQEYLDLFNAVSEFSRSEKSKSKELRAKIMLELGDLEKLAGKGGQEKFGWFRQKVSEAGDYIKGTDTKEAKKEAISIRQKDVYSFSKEEAIAAMQYLSENYSSPSYTENDDNASKFISWISNVSETKSIDNLTDKYQVRLFQDELRRKIFGNENGFNDEFILGFNKLKGNHIISIKDFEKSLGKSSLQEINSTALENYFLYLENKGKLNLETVVKVFGPDTILELEDFWMKKDSKSSNEKLKGSLELRKIGAFDKILENIHDLKGTFGDLDKLVEAIVKTDFSDPNFETKRDIALLFFKRNMKGLNAKMEDDLLKKYQKNNPGVSKEKSLEIVKGIMSELKNYKDIKDIPKLLKRIYEIDKENNLGLKITKKFEELGEMFETNSNISLLELNKELKKIRDEIQKEQNSGNDKRLGVLQRQEQKLEQQIEEAKVGVEEQKVAKPIREEIKRDEGIAIEIATSDDKKGQEKLGEVVEKLKQENPEFAEAYKKLENKKEELYQKYPELKENNKKESEKVSDEEKGQKTTKKDENEDYRNLNVTYQRDSGVYEVNISGPGSESFTLTKDEFEKVKDNKKLFENVVDFYKELKETELDFVWNYRNSFKKFEGLNLNIENGITENEMLKLYNFIGEKIGKNWNNLSDAKKYFVDLKNGKNLGEFVGRNNSETPEKAKLEGQNVGNLFKYLKDNDYFNQYGINEHKWMQQDKK